MHKLFVKNYQFFIITVLLVIGFILRFYNLNWGAPFYFHPDERNIASSISELNFPNQMNPHFFAYGSLPIYLVYFIGLLMNLFINCHISTFNCTQINFTQAILLLRTIAAVSSLLLIPLSFYIGNYLKNRPVGYMAAFLTTFSVGLIQFAHFGTYEMWLTIFSTLMFGTCLWYYKTNKLLPFILMALTTSILCASKVTSFVLLPIPLLLIIKLSIEEFKIYKFIRHKVFHSFFVLLKLILFLFIVADIYILTNPYTFLDKPSFLNSMHYESGVALGTEPVFYTGEFYNTTPVIFQFIHVFPFLLNPLITVIFLFSFIYICYLIVNPYLSHISLLNLNSKPFRNRRSQFNYFLVIIFFLLIFLSQAFFFVKWTRYMVPTLPFIYLIVSIFLFDFYTYAQKKWSNIRITTVYVGVLACTVIFALSYIISVYVEPDTRLQALQAAKEILPSDTNILSEVYDLGIIPFNNYYTNIKLYNFYDLDNPSSQTNSTTLKNALQAAQAIILPSQRIMKVRIDNPQKFPKGHNLYSRLFSGQLGFKLIYETPCDIFCKITYLGSPVFSYEETASVFDRPTVFIFKKIKQK